MTFKLLDHQAPRVTTLEGWPDFGALLEALGSRRQLVALDSAGEEPANWSWIAFDPARTVDALPARLQELGDWMGSLPDVEAGSVPGPFTAGFLGALAYDQGVPADPLDLPEDPWQLPSLVGGFYRNFFVFDHRARQVHLVLDREHEAERAELTALAHGSRQAVEVEGDFRCTSNLRRRVSSADHQARIECARAQIAAGEYYQANLAHPFEVDCEGDPLYLYSRLRRANPAPYMGFLRFAHGALLSASPELLLECDGREARTRPIKGTAARHVDEHEDARLGRELLESDKDRAELAMIVDLMRNDLGRVAEIGSVRVDGFPTLRSYRGVHHLMADVRGRLAAGRTTHDLLCSIFPGGSITGAPKLRAMGAIAELEGEGRGFFTGSMGYLDCNGAACFNILIRTMQWRPSCDGGAAGQVRYHVGGGITWSSEAKSEDRETLIKGAKLASVLGFDAGLEG